MNGAIHQARIPWRTRLRQPDEYGIGLVLILLTVLLTSALGDEHWGQLIAAVVSGFTLIFILNTSRVRRPAIRAAAVIVVVAIVTATAAVFFATEPGRTPYLAVVAIMAVGAPVAIARRLLTHQVITIRTVGGALCVYLLIGLFYATLYAVVNDVSGDFFAQTTAPDITDFVYYSYITLTTVGYGDLTPAAAGGRMLAVTEALVGQLYLVSAVALLVGNLGRVRTAPGGAPDLIDELGTMADNEADVPLSSQPSTTLPQVGPPSQPRYPDLPANEEMRP